MHNVSNQRKEIRMKKVLMNSILTMCLFVLTACNPASRLSPEELQAAIFVAVREDDVDAMKSYIDAGADINETTEGITVLDVAALRGNHEMILLLLNSGAQFDTDTFHHAITGSDDDVSIVQIFLDHGADVSGRDDSPPGHSPLMYAAEHGYVAVGKLLLEKGADLEQVDDYNDPALNVAAFFGQLEFVKMLVERGAKLDVYGFGGRNAIRHAMANNHNDVVDFLRSVGSPE
jgi:ankyrin repeat protein